MITLERHDKSSNPVAAPFILKYLTMLHNSKLFSIAILIVILSACTNLEQLNKKTETNSEIKQKVAEVNLEPKDKEAEAYARKATSTLTMVQQSYYLRAAKFTTQFADLADNELGIRGGRLLTPQEVQELLKSQQSTNYFYILRQDNPNTVYALGIPKNEKLKAFVGVVSTPKGDGNTRAGLCQADSAGTSLPKLPQILGDSLSCGEGTSGLREVYLINPKDGSLTPQ